MATQLEGLVAGPLRIYIYFCGFPNQHITRAKHTHNHTPDTIGLNKDKLFLRGAWFQKKLPSVHAVVTNFI